MTTYSDNAIAQFENVNSMRTYPFAADSSLVDRNGRELPNDVIVDLKIAAPMPSEHGLDVGVYKSTSVAMKSVHLSKSMISVCFTASNGATTQALSATVAVSNFAPYRPVRLEKLSGSEDIGGIVTFGDMELPSHPETYFFDNAVVFDGCVMAVRPAGLRKFYDPRSGESVSGDAEITFSGYVSASKDGNEFKLTLDDGASEELASECANAGGYEVCGATPITSINGVKPDADGNIVLWFH